MGYQWRLVAVFDHHETAKQAAAMLQAMNARETTYTAEIRGSAEVVWREETHGYVSGDGVRL